jgi:hypothetical protein
MKLCIFIVVSVIAVSATAQQPGYLGGMADEDTMSAAEIKARLNPDTINMNVQLRKAKKSIKGAFLGSLLLPGAGEYYVGSKTQAKVFAGAEAMIWAFAAISKFRGEMWKRDYRNYAAQYAGANPDRTEDIYYQNMYEYSSSYWYNQDAWVEARMIYPDDPQAQESYVADLLYGPEDEWTWTSYSDWNSYRGLRIKSQESLHRINYSYGAAILNHLLSAVNAARIAKKYNKRRLSRADHGENWRLRFFSANNSAIGIALGRGL